MTTDLRALFAPRRVAVLGASRSPDKLGHRLLQNVLEGEFPGEVLPVNPSGEPILGIKSFRAVSELPLGIDLALVSLPAGAVLEAVRALGARRCGVTVVLASGFGETGQPGQMVQAELARIAGATGMRIVGPNCMGVVNVPGRLNGSYFWNAPRVPGGISFVSQSGAYGGLFFREARARGLGVSKFVSIGNQADLGFPECLEALAADPETRVIALFVEGVRDGARFVDAARRAARHRAVVAFKAGRDGAGRRAAGSHTGSLVGAYEAYLAAFAAAGVVVAADTESFFDAIVVLDAQAGRLPADDTIAIITVSGGPSVIAADTAEAIGLRVPLLPDAVRQSLRRHLPAFGADSNPVDMTPQIEPAGFAPAVRMVLEEESIAGAVAINVGLDREEYGLALVEAQAATGKPVVACTADTPVIEARLRGAGIPAFPTPERAVRAYGALLARARLDRRRASEPRPPRPSARGLDLTALDGDRPLPYALARGLLESYGVPFPAEGVAATEEEAVRIAGEIGYPVVVKTLLPTLTHKSDAGGVVLDLRDATAVRATCRTLRARFGDADLLVQHQLGRGLELLLGGRRDPTFGAIVVCGLGGIFAEAFQEVSVGLAPLGPDEARAMLREGRKGKLLGGFRGLPPADESRLTAVLMGIGDLLVDHPRVGELDVNPLIVAGDDVAAVDALLIPVSASSA